MSRARHLTSRFFASLRPRAVGDADVAWVRLALTPAEFACWQQLGRADRAESLATGRTVAQQLGPDADTRWIAAALLHDIGKIDSHLGTVGRAGATILAAVVSHGRARTWPNAIGRYVDHDDLGAERLEAAGARPEAVAWAKAHHRSEQWPRTGIPAEICVLLAEADGESPRSRTPG